MKRRTVGRTLGLLVVVGLALVLASKATHGPVFPAAETALLALGIWFLA